MGARSGSRLAPGHVRTEREHSRPEAPGSGGRADRSHPQAQRLRGLGPRACWGARWERCGTPGGHCARPWLHAPLPTRRRPGRSDRASHAVRLALGKGSQADCVRSSWGAGPVSPSHSHRALPQAGSLTGNHSPCSEAGSRDPGRAGPSELRGSVRSRPPPPRLCLSSHGVCIRVRSSHSHEDTGRPGSGACEDLVLADCPQGPTSKGGILRAAC